MKLLMFDTNEFWYKTFGKTLDHVDTVDTEASVGDALVIFINVEKEDEAQRDKIVKKAVENICWLAKKRVGTEWFCTPLPSSQTVSRALRSPRRYLG